MIMKNLIFLSLIPVLLLISCKKEHHAPEGLMVEFIRSPQQVAICDASPEFSWITDPAIGRQSAYRIQVASTEDFTKSDAAGWWDTGKTISNRSVEITYEGSPLEPYSRYYWRVRTWDEAGQGSLWSAPQRFMTSEIIDYDTTPNVFESELIKPQKANQSGSGPLFYDFGKAAFGTLELSLSTDVRDTLTIHLGEKLSGPTTIDRNPPGSVRYQKVQLVADPGQAAYQIKLPPDTRNTNEMAVALPDSFPVVMPFRYCEIEGKNSTTRVNNIHQIAYHYFFDEDASYFSSPDTVLNQVWELCKYSIKATSFTGLYIDGDRERIPYEADALINQLAHYCTDREYSMARRTNEYFIDHPTWPTEWILQTILLFHYDYMYTGNAESIRQYYDLLKFKTLLGLAREDGLISTHSEKLTGELMSQLGFSDSQQRIRDIVDWPPSQEESDREYASVYGERDHYDMVPVNTVVNAFHYQALKLMADMAGIVNEKEDSVYFGQRAALVKTSINERLLNKEKGIYIDGETSTHSSLHANMMPLAFGIVPEAYRYPVIEFIKSRGMACSVYGSQFLMDALYEAGEEEYAMKLLTATHDRSWWNMIQSGSTISMEAWDMKYKPNADWNHAWGAAPANIIPRQLWGIKPMAPGFQSVMVKPQLHTLSESRIRMPTIRGAVIAEFHMANDTIKVYNIHLPGNTKGKFIPVEKSIESILVNGISMDTVMKSYSIQAGSNRIEIFL